MTEDTNGNVTNKMCTERREYLRLEAAARAESTKVEAFARADAIKIATARSDGVIDSISNRLDTMDTRINNLILLILGQLLAFIFGLIMLIVSGKV